MIRYHDLEWGVPVSSARAAFEHLALETMQAGLSWRLILSRRDAFRAAWHGFDPERLAACDDRDVERWMNDATLIRNHAKLRAVIANARAFLELEASGRGLQATLAAFLSDEDRWPRRAPGEPAAGAIPASHAAAKELKARGFRFVGGTVIYAHMQATGLVHDHDAACFRRAEDTGHDAARVEGVADVADGSGAHGVSGGRSAS